MDAIRDAALDAFLGALSTCFFHAIGDQPEDAAFVERLFTMLAVPARGGGTRAARGLDALDALGSWPAALDGLRDAALPVRTFGQALADVEPRLAWTRRPHQGPDAERFAAGHAYAYIVGPGGLEDRDDAMIGVTLMAPDIRYPDHSHPPDELYVALSEGEWASGRRAMVRAGRRRHGAQCARHRPCDAIGRPSSFGGLGADRLSRRAVGPAQPRIRSG